MLNIVVALVLLPAAPVPANEYVFTMDTDRFVRVLRFDEGREFTARGWLDAAGNFVPNRSGWGKSIDAYSGLTSLLLNPSRLGACHESRSGVLIQGRIDAKTYNFVPELGSTVIDFQDYLKNYRTGDPTVWNLPGTIHKKGTLTPEQEELRKFIQILVESGAEGPIQFTYSSPNGPPAFLRSQPSNERGAAPARAPAAAAMEPVPPGVYEYLPDTSRWVEVRRRYGDEEYWSIGKLDAAGNFIPDRDYLNQTGPRPAGAPAAISLNPERIGAVYEYRSGRLIKGRIDDKLNFVPEVGSKVIDFKGYTYGSESSKHGPDPLPIWNLPGTFQKKEPGKK